jgi:hypothetical protein
MRWENLCPTSLANTPIVRRRIMPISSISFFSNLQAIVHTFQRLLDVEHVLDNTSDI